MTAGNIQDEDHNRVELVYLPLLVELVEPRLQEEDAWDNGDVGSFLFLDSIFSMEKALDIAHSWLKLLLINIMSPTENLLVFIYTVVHRIKGAKAGL